MQKYFFLTKASIIFTVKSNKGNKGCLNIWTHNDQDEDSHRDKVKYFNRVKLFYNVGTYYFKK
jgi:hypothetical protein